MFQTLSCQWCFEHAISHVQCSVSNMLRTHVSSKCVRVLTTIMYTWNVVILHDLILLIIVGYNEIVCFAGPTSKPRLTFLFTSCFTVFLLFTDGDTRARNMCLKLTRNIILWICSQTCWKHHCYGQVGNIVWKYVGITSLDVSRSEHDYSCLAVSWVVSGRCPFWVKMEWFRDQVLLLTTLYSGIPLTLST